MTQEANDHILELSIWSRPSWVICTLLKVAKLSWGNTRTPKQEEVQVCLLEAVHISVSNL